MKIEDYQMEITYQEAEEIVRNHLKSLSNLADYSKKLKSSYQVLSLIKNNNSRGKVFSKVVFDVLTDLGYKPKINIIKVVNFEIKKK